jgi:hypothetical protein
MLSLPLGLFGVVADEISYVVIGIVQLDCLDLKVVGDLLVAASATENLFGQVFVPPQGDCHEVAC